MPSIRVCLGPTLARRHHRCQLTTVRSMYNSACLQRYINDSLIYTSWTHGDPWEFPINTHVASMLLLPYNGIIPGSHPPVRIGSSPVLDKAETQCHYSMRFIVLVSAISSGKMQPPTWTCECARCAKTTMARLRGYQLPFSGQVVRMQTI